MTLMKFKPFAPSQYLFGDLYDELFNNFLSDMKSPANYTQPAVNIIEEKDRYILELAVPGVNKKDIDIKMEDNELIISSNIEQKEEEKEENMVRMEYNYTSFKRVFTIPQTIDTKHIEAEYKDGILKITMKKKEEAIKKGPKAIKIK